MVPVQYLCRKHLCGEHGELHKFLHNWRKKHRVDKRIQRNQMEPKSYKTRHDRLAKEMLHRDYNHKSPLDQPDFSYLPEFQQEYKVDIKASLQELLDKCPECRKRYEEIVDT